MLRSDPIVILGSTGSVGKSAVDIVSKDKESFQVVLLAAQKNSKALLAQARTLGCPKVYLEDPQAQKEASGVSVLTKEELLRFLAEGTFDTVVFAITDFELSTLALKTVLERSDCSLKVAVASKETVVVFGKYFRQLANINKHTLLPLDSEPSAIFQCLGSLETKGQVAKIYLTATGGPFYRKSLDPKRITPEAALKHPIWAMGPKITIDSATLMNKAFELMEISNLFEIEPKNIEILIHPQCVIHSMVAMKNSSILAQLGPADMRLPIQFALYWPEGFRRNGAVGALSYEKLKSLTFEKPDTERFPCLKIALRVALIKDESKAMKTRAALVASDEEAVKSFLKGELSYDKIPRALEKIVELFDEEDRRNKQDGFIAQGLAVYQWARGKARKIIAEAR